MVVCCVSRPRSFTRSDQVLIPNLVKSGEHGIGNRYIAWAEIGSDESCV